MDCTDQGMFRDARTAKRSHREGVLYVEPIWRIQMVDGSELRVAVLIRGIVL